MFIFITINNNIKKCLDVLILNDYKKGNITFNPFKTGILLEIFHSIVIANSTEETVAPEILNICEEMFPQSYLHSAIHCEMFKHTILCSQQ